ncbi:LysR family transcriptional regulator [Erysipelothrix aquatica]|uniref:LysR family transcriptional regulator n=1 Tax=Erysipelothrix aquatica TaxID=2683714 RepID=UPI0013574AE9|nr:LysR family transcriptional regulator [Erysipelothrix aquatica]
MNIDRINMFLAVCIHGSISRAAEALYISQPAVSQGIKELELELNVKLFQRTGRTITPTQEALLFYPYAQALIQANERASSVFKTDVSLPVLRVGCTVTIATYMLPEIITHFETLHHIQLQITVNNVATIKESVVNNNLDVALMEGVPDNDTLSYSRVGTLDLVYVASPSYLQNHKGRYHLLTREIGSSYRKYMDRIIYDDKIESIISWTANNNETLLHAAIGGHGVAVLPRIAVVDYIKKGILDIVVFHYATFTEEIGIINNAFRTHEMIIKSFVDNVRGFIKQERK